MRDPLLNQISQDELDQIKDRTFDIESIDSLQRNNQLYIYIYIYICWYILGAQFNSNVKDNLYRN